jgi:hypothetical protein
MSLVHGYPNVLGKAWPLLSMPSSRAHFGEAGSHERCVQALMVLLVSKMPRLRSLVAEHLFLSTAILLATSTSCNDTHGTWSAGRLTTLQDILRAQCWDTGNMDEVKAARLRVISLLELPAPVASKVVMMKSVGPGQADESYQALLNDFARGL